MGLEFGKAKNIYVKGSSPQTEGKINNFLKNNPGFFIFLNPFILALSTVLVNKRGEWVTHRNHLLSWTKDMKATGQAKWVCGFSP